jgi:hypothetical protein
MKRFPTTLPKALILFLGSLWLGGCLYYDYGVDKTKTKLPYRTYYFGEKDKKYDFTTVLYCGDQEPKGRNYTGFTISISHMFIETRKNENKGKYISEILFSGSTTNEDIQLLPDSIILVHKDKNGKILPYEKVEHDVRKKPKGKYFRHYYRKVYDPSILSDEITEYISLEVLVKGVKEKIEDRLFIQKALHYTWWEVLMGI